VINDQQAFSSPIVSFEFLDTTGSLISGGRSEMPSEDAAHDVFVDLDAKCVSNLLGNSRTTEARIAVLHFEDRRDEFR
jgi:hypothetical protein